MLRGEVWCSHGFVCFTRCRLYAALDRVTIVRATQRSSPLRARPCHLRPGHPRRTRASQPARSPETFFENCLANWSASASPTRTVPTSTILLWGEDRFGFSLLSDPLSATFLAPTVDATVAMTTTRVRREISPARFHRGPKTVKTSFFTRLPVRFSGETHLSGGKKKISPVRPPLFAPLRNFSHRLIGKREGQT